MVQRKIQLLVILLVFFVFSGIASAEIGDNLGGDAGWFQFNSNVEGASVFVDGKFVGYTPYTMLVHTTGTPYKRAYASKSGYYDSDTESLIMPSAGQTNTYYFTLQKRVTPTPTQPKLGDIYVQTNPSGARVHIDDNYVGLSPQTFYNYPSNRYHHVEIEKDGYRDWSTSIYVKTGETNRVYADLIQKSQPTTGSISVSSTPPGAQIYLDGTYKGITSENSFFIIRNVAAGTHTVTLEIPGYEDATTSVTINSGQTSTVQSTLVPKPDPQPGYGSIMITSSPSGANVLLDNALKGTTPETIHNLNPGTYTVALQLPGYEDWSTQVQVSANEKTSITATMTPTAQPTPTKTGLSPIPAFAAVILTFAALIAIRRRENQ